MYAGQFVIQRLLLVLALLCVPWLFFAKPFVLKREAASKPAEHFDFVEIMIHQGKLVIIIKQFKYGYSFSEKKTKLLTKSGIYFHE